ncbi:MAG: metallophosphoesterase, partial [Clostridia bacterium]|nr:metallophosphoesterase [Clostridia bacterium]
MDWKNREKYDLTFTVLSDLHMTHRGQGLQKLNMYRCGASEMNPKPERQRFAGDLVYQIDCSGGGVCPELYPEPYDYLNMALSRYTKDIPTFYVMGNHEFPQNRHEPELMAQARELFKEKTGKPLMFHETVNGYHFIGFSCMAWDIVPIPEVEKYVTREVKKALKESTLPVFVLYHRPIRHTVEDSEEPSYSEAFGKFLLSDKRIINICGHLHTPSDSPVCLYQKKGG